MSTHYGHTWPVPDFDRLVTYGEVAQRRYAIGKAAVDAARQYREARLVENQERQLQAEQIANQQFANSMSAWANYMHAVNARQPQTVHLTGAPIHCTTTNLGGGMASTNCN
ncbi:hypothetical protein [Paraburkholderia sp. 32]|uniref:hypothetical protein n=1 Tax=Paraburkholderia sp. 32 TaxID=2991057 RepID=UPI003D24BB6B